MRTQRRRRAAALGCIAIAAAIAIGARDSGSPSSPDPARVSPHAEAEQRNHASSRQPKVAELATSGPGGAHAAVEIDGLPPAGYIARHRPLALRVARRFLDGYFAFEVGQGGERAAREVAQTAAPSLAADLLAGGAQLPAAMDHLPPRAEVYAIDIEFDKPPTAALIRAEVKRDEDRSDIGVIAERKDTRWVITQITE